MKKITVIGAGTMGQGIAQVCAMAGIPTALFDLNQEALKSAESKIYAMIQKGIDRKKTDPAVMDLCKEKLSFEQDLATASNSADCVVEAIFEDIEVKQKLFKEISEFVSNDCLLASNTSSLSITGIASAVPNPSRVLGMHFFNPVPIMPLLEIVRGMNTDDTSIDQALALSGKLGKEAIVVNDSPGFATSRLGVAIGLEAIRMLEQGVASAADIDKAMELGYKHPMGPLRLTDLVGLDVRLAIAEHLHKEVGEQFRPPSLLRNMVRAGKLGKKSSEGFYDWK